MILYLDFHYRGRVLISALDHMAKQVGTQVLALMNHQSEIDWIKKQCLSNVLILDVRERFRDQDLKHVKFSSAESLMLRRFILADRRLREMKKDKRDVYIKNWYVLLERLCKENDFSFCVGEPTWFNELYTFYKLEQLGVLCVEPSPNRFDPSRFNFLTGRTEFSIVESKQNHKEKNSIAWSHAVQDSIRNFDDNPILKINRNSTNFSVKYLSDAWKMYKLAYATQRNEYIHQHAVPAFADKLRSTFFRKYHAYWLEQHASVPLDSSSYVFYPLHLQPERSIDVMGTNYSHTLEVIRQIALNWPFKEIYVKEHPTAIGKRSTKFYKELINIPGVKLIKPSIKTKELLKRASFVYSISGTILMEASVLGVCAGCSSETYFADYLSHGFVDPFKALGPPQKARDINGLFEKLYATSFLGNTRDQFMNPTALSSENVNNISNAFRELYYNVKK